MILSDEQKQQADRLLLTYTEMSVALKTRIAPEVYAQRKQELLADRDAWEAKLSGMSDAMLERAAYFAPYGRGERPWPKETDEASSEEGG